MRGFAFGTGPEIRFWKIAGHRDLLSPYRLPAANHPKTRITLVMPIMVKELAATGACRHNAAAGLLEEAGGVGAVVATRLQGLTRAAALATTDALCTRPP
jgi:hypothetical protein